MMSERAPGTCQITRCCQFTYQARGNCRMVIEESAWPKCKLFHRFSAFPDLLGACEEALRVFGKIPPSTSKQQEGAMNGCMIRLKTQIAKAKGE